MTVRNRIAIVTGGSKGIGRGIAEALAKEGAKVAIFARRDPDVAAAELREMGYEATGFSVDLTDRASIDQGVEAVLAKYGRIDILVNNAGLMENLPFLETPPENLDKHLNLNLKGPWNMAQSVVPHMKEQHYGRVITVASVTGAFVDNGEDMSYSITKAALLGFCRCLAMEFIHDGITSNLICPGYCETEMVHQEAKEICPENPQSVIDAIHKAVPIGHMVRPQDIGFAATCLAADEASYMTGQTVVVDGGCILPEIIVDIDGYNNSGK